MDKSTATNQAIARIKGQECAPGTIVAHESHPLTWELVRYDGKDAVVRGKDDEQRTFPASEIFDVKKVINVGNHLLNLGFWEEGMDGIMVTIGARD